MAMAGDRGAICRAAAGANLGQQKVKAPEWDQGLRLLNGHFNGGSGENDRSLE